MRQVFQLLAMVISIALTPIITEKIGYSLTAVLYSILAVSVILFMTFGCHEDPEAQKKPKPQLFKTVWDIAKNPKFWIYGLTNAAFFASLAIVLAAVPFFVKYTLGEGGLGATIMQGTVILVAIVGIAIWVQIMKKKTLMPTWRLSLICVCLGFIPLYFTNTLLSATLALVVFGFGLGGTCVTMDIVAARILDEDSARYGVQREGTFSSLTGILNKTSGLFSSLAFYLVFALFGFESGDNPGPMPGEAARFLMILFPFAVMVLCCVASFFLKFGDANTKAPAQADSSEA